MSSRLAATGHALAAGISADTPGSRGRSARGRWRRSYIQIAAASGSWGTAARSPFLLRFQGLEHGERYLQLIPQTLALNGFVQVAQQLSEAVHVDQQPLIDRRLRESSGVQHIRNRFEAAEQLMGRVISHQNPLKAHSGFGHAGTMMGYSWGLAIRVLKWRSPCCS